MKRVFVLLVSFVITVLALTGCPPVPTPTQSPLPTPTPNSVEVTMLPVGFPATLGLDAETLTYIAAALLSLAFSYIPWFRRWYEPLEREYKQMIMGALLIVVSAAILGLSCSDVINVVPCDKAGVLGLIGILFRALIANQAVYSITKRRKKRND